MNSRFILNSGKFTLLSFLFLSAQLTYGQSALGILDLYHDASLSLKNKTIMEASADNDAFGSRLSGISFEAVAVPAENLKNEKISLDYRNNRLVVTVGAKSFTPDIPVWQWLPVAQFANSPYQIAYFYSGNTDKQEAQCKYHPAFLNNLLGLRLFQADLLNKPDIIWDLPVDRLKKYLLDLSERRYTPKMDTLIFKTVYEALISGKRKFSSYVLTDKDVVITFETNASEFKLSGHPYYNFNKTEIDMDNVQKLRQDLEKLYNEIDEYAKLILQEKYASNLDAKTNLKGLLKTIDDNKAKATANSYATYYFKKAVENLDAMNKLTDKEIGVKFSALDEFSSDFNRLWPLLKKYNSPVYTTVENASRWAAFFRYVMKTNPDNWRTFIETTKDVEIISSPLVKTPTSFDTNYLRIFSDKK
ncbi:MAG: hypothetical protein LBU22_04700 [Dysgonamonadaceae bacterium]|nr:hypothetical protein [Dysgonamonadaceae bacterium]